MTARAGPRFRRPRNTRSAPSRESASRIAQLRPSGALAADRQKRIVLVRACVSAGRGGERMELSYTQNLEDFHLSLAFAGQATGTYIDVGAGHPVADNVSFWFYERGWSGVGIEPQPELVDLYKQLRPRDRVVRGLVGRADGEIDFYLVDRLHGFSTTVQHHADKAKAFGVDYRTLRMPVTTLARLCETHGLDAVDFLKIDVEGGEADVLLGGDWRRFRPKVVVMEAIAPGSKEPAWAEWEPFLLEQGYRFALFDTLNRFYVAEEHPDTLARLPRQDVGMLLGD